MVPFSQQILRCTASFEKQVVAVAIRVFPQIYIVPIPGYKGPPDSHLCPSNLMCGILQCALRRAALEDYSEVTAGFDYGGTGSNGHAISYVGNHL